MWIFSSNYCYLAEFNIINSDERIWSRWRIEWIMWKLLCEIAYCGCRRFVLLIFALPKFLLDTLANEIPSVNKWFRNVSHKFKHTDRNQKTWLYWNSTDEIILVKLDWIFRSAEMRRDKPFRDRKLNWFWGGNKETNSHNFYALGYIAEMETRGFVV